MLPAEQAVELLFTPGEWFQFPTRLLRHMKPTAVILFAYLAGYSRKLGRNEGANDGWFYRTIDDVLQDLNMTEDTQYRNIKALQEIGVLEMRLTGMPAKRHFRVAWSRVISLLNSGEPLESAEVRSLVSKEPGSAEVRSLVSKEPGSAEVRSLESAEVRSLESAEVRDKREVLNKKKRQKEVRSPSALPGREPDGFEPRQQPAVPAKPFQQEADSAAAKLLAMLQEHRAVMRPPAMPKWAEAFRIFYEQCPAQSRQRITTVLNWYIKNYGKPYVPDIRSANAFCERFEQIDKAMNRAAQDSKRGGNNGLPPGVRCARTMTNRDPDLPWEHMAVYLNTNDDGDFDENCRDTWMRAVYGKRQGMNIFSQQIYVPADVEKELIAELEKIGVFAKKNKPYYEAYEE